MRFKREQLKKDQNYVSLTEPKDLSKVQISFQEIENNLKRIKEECFKMIMVPKSLIENKIN